MNCIVLFFLINSYSNNNPIISNAQLRSHNRFINVINLSKTPIDYHKAWKWQTSLVDHYISLQESLKSIPLTTQSSLTTGSLLVLQHKSVYTLGSSTNNGSGPFSSVDENGISLDYDTIKVDRAGEATYHGPGQVVLYPIIDLNYYQKDINIYLRNLEELVIRTLASFNITAERIAKPGYTGVWVNEQYKIAAIGVKISRWVTMHGVSLNIDPDMRYFKNIIPCGIKDKEVGSMKQFMEVRSHYHPALPYHSAVAEGLGQPPVTEDYDNGNSDGSTVLVTEKETAAAETSLLYDRIVMKLIQNFMQVFEAEIGSTISNQDAINYLDELHL